MSREGSLAEKCFVFMCLEKNKKSSNTKEILKGIEFQASPFALNSFFKAQL